MSVVVFVSVLETQLILKVQLHTGILTLYNFARESFNFSKNYLVSSVIYSETTPLRYISSSKIIWYNFSKSTKRFFIAISSSASNPCFFGELLSANRHRLRVGNNSRKCEKYSGLFLPSIQYENTCMV